MCEKFFTELFFPVHDKWSLIIFTRRVIIDSEQKSFDFISTPNDGTILLSKAKDKRDR